MTLRDLTAAYACLAREGKAVTLNLEKAPAGESSPERSVLPAASCFLVADILADREARRATFGDHELMNLPFRYACKTGTSSDFRDNWCVGFTREITVGVWVGNFDASPMRQVGGMTGAGPIFAGVMKLAHRNRKATFPQPGADLVRILIDSRTGKRTGAMQIPAAYVREEWASPANMPGEASPGDYDARGRAYLDSRYTEWFTSPSLHGGGRLVPASRVLVRRTAPRPRSPVRLPPDSGPGNARGRAHAQIAVQPAHGSSLVMSHSGNRAIRR